jgi:thiol-disulfide isomerase/thioredoxin
VTDGASGAIIAEERPQFGIWHGVNNMNVYIKGGIAALIMAGAIYAWYQWKEPSLPVNQSPVGFQLIKQMERDGVPDISLMRVDGTPLKLASLRGKIVIVNFWASWCNPCVEEFPSLIKLMAQFNKDVVVLAVSEDETREDMQAFMKAMGLPRPGIEIVWDEKKENMKAYGVEKIPETFLVGRDGKLIRKVLGIENWANEDAMAYFKMLTGEGTPAHATPPDALVSAESSSPPPTPSSTPAPEPKAKKKSPKKKKKHHRAAA